jgi:histidinol dehydrogenase
VNTQLAEMKRAKAIATALENCGGIFVVKDLLADGIEIADEFAAEHLEIFCRKETEAKILKQVPVAGAVFVRTGEAFADYGMTGGNHILPTKRTARFSSGLSARDFLVWQYVEELTDEGQKKLARMANTFADIESLEAHANAARQRVGKEMRQKKTS